MTSKVERRHLTVSIASRVRILSWSGAAVPVRVSLRRGRGAARHGRGAATRRTRRFPGILPTFYGLFARHLARHFARHLKGILRDLLRTFYGLQCRSVRRTAAQAQERHERGRDPGRPTRPPAAVSAKPPPAVAGAKPLWKRGGLGLGWLPEPARGPQPVAVKWGISVNW